MCSNISTSNDVTECFRCGRYHAHYFSRYQQYDISCQALCDGTTKFIHVAAGYPGSVHDARIYRRSKIGTLKLDAPKMIVDGKSISPYLIGDSAYPISRELIKPYSHLSSDRKEKRFSYELSKSRVVIEQAFGSLKFYKSVWPSLQTLQRKYLWLAQQCTIFASNRMIIVTIFMNKMSHPIVLQEKMRLMEKNFHITLHHRDSPDHSHLITTRNMARKLSSFQLRCREIQYIN